MLSNADVVENSHIAPQADILKSPSNLQIGNFVGS